MVCLTVIVIFFSTAGTSLRINDLITQNNNTIDENNIIESHETIANWTIMYYMAGDVKNMGVWTRPLIENLTKIKTTADLNIVVLYDGYERGDVELFYIDTNGEKIDIKDDFGWPCEVDTSNLNTIEVFCKQMMDAFPAKNYGLIPIASGGTGWQLFCLHDASDGKIGVSIPDFADTLKNIYEETNQKIDVLFTSCAMNMIEVVYEFSPYVNYVVGTQTCYSGEYLVQRFYEAVWDLKNDSTMNPEEFANKAPERLNPIAYYYQESYYGKLPILNRILLKLPFKAFYPILYKDSTAVVNLSNINNLARSIHNISQFLILNDLKCSIREAVHESWKDTKKLGECFANNKLLQIFHYRFHFQITSSTRYIDIYHFMMLLKNNTENLYLKSLCNDVMINLNNTISSIKTLEDDNQHGLSIYFPPNKYNYNRFPNSGRLPCPYEELKFSQDTSWDEFLKTYFNI